MILEGGVGLSLSKTTGELLPTWFAALREGSG